jgi:hypothetical protein
VSTATTATTAATPPARDAVPAAPLSSIAPVTAGGARIGAAFERAARDGRIALVPYVVAGYPDATTSRALAEAAIDAGADLLEMGPRTPPRRRHLQRASSAALRAGARSSDRLRSESLLRLVRSSRAYRWATQSAIGGGDGGDRGATRAGGGERLIVAT